jgi:hypothetical protein
MRIYAREGVAFLWLVDPLAHTLEPFRLEGRRWTTEGALVGQERVRVEPFVELELDLSRLWVTAEPTEP